MIEETCDSGIMKIFHWLIVNCHPVWG